MSDPFRRPLKADEIEALLRSARGLEANRSDIVSGEPLGPGDVQYLQNSVRDDVIPAGSGWPYDPASADELLQRAQQHLASAMSQDELPKTESLPTPPLPFTPYPPAPPAAPGTGGLPLSVVGEIELDVTLELGRADLMIEDLLALREGSVVTLDKDAGEPIDILANGKLIARGEVIVVDDKFCVRICEVLGSS